MSVLRLVDKLEIWLESSRLRLVDNTLMSALSQSDKVLMSVDSHVDNRLTSVLIPSDKALI